MPAHSPMDNHKTTLPRCNRSHHNMITFSARFSIDVKPTSDNQEPRESTGRVFFTTLVKKKSIIVRTLEKKQYLCKLNQFESNF